MKFKIDPSGYLHIMRGKVMEKQFCPYAPRPIECSHHCPLFGEPYHLGISNSTLALCKTELSGECTDERV